MKRLICFISAFLVFTTPVTAFATADAYKGDGFSISFPENYIVIDENNLSSNEEFITSIDNHSVESFKRTMQESNMLVFAAPEDNSQQVQLYKWSDTVSTTVHSLNLLNDELFDTTAASIKQIITSNKNAGITLSEKIKKQDVTFIKYVVYYEDKNSDYGSVQYWTVSEDNFYSLNFYNKDGKITDSQNAVAEEIFSSLKINVKKSVNFTYYLLRFAGALLIIGGLIALIFIVRSIYFDIKQSKNADEKIPDKIKMNRKKKK
ncbi:MAG: hypothetical protein UHN02_03650 [Acutalibacteraceae bacterium]|nr:hypothetical protein [Acutalibacteraceae bacterium]